MRRVYKATVVVALIMILLMNPVLLAWGNPPPGRWEKVAETKPGDWMKIYTKDGNQHNHHFMSLNDKFLICKNDHDELSQYELVKVDKIVLPKSVRYGKEWAVVGAVGGCVVGAIYSAFLDFVPSGRVAVAAAGAGIGALGGLLAGSTLGAPGETVYISKELAMKKAKK